MTLQVSLQGLNTKGGAAHSPKLLNDARQHDLGSRRATWITKRDEDLPERCMHFYCGHMGTRMFKPWNPASRE